MSNKLTLHNLITHCEKIPISNIDIKEANPTTNVIIYSDLQNINNVESLFGEDNTCILLYELDSEVGHWICLLHYPEINTIEVFDSYGMDIDEELNKYKHKEKYLSKLLYNSGKRLKVNKTRLQQFKEYVNTCGRWALMRSIFNNYNNEQFTSLFKNKPKITNNDEIITAFTMLSLRKYLV